MATNSYFNHYNAVNEQDLIDSLVIESIQAQGIDVAYIPRSQADIDYLYNEDPNNIFASHTTIEMYPIFVDGFDGDQLMSVFGDEFKKSGTFVVSKTRFGQEFVDFIRPREGDLIFMPITNALLEIKFVEHESPFFEKGKQYVYELKTQAFEYSYEQIDTQDPELDDIINSIKIDVPGEELEDYGKNDEIEQSTDDDIVFDPSNPFSVK